MGWGSSPTFGEAGFVAFNWNQRLELEIFGY